MSSSSPRDTVRRNLSSVAIPVLFVVNLANGLTSGWNTGRIAVAIFTGILAVRYCAFWIAKLRDGLRAAIGANE
jgi:hypothetical protein